MPSSSPGSELAYHGTDHNSAQSILRSQFRVGAPDDGKWLGQGAYFFVEGVSVDPPERNAKEWALFDARRKSARQWSVLKTEVTDQHLLDLTTTKQLKVFNEVREKLRGKVKPTQAEYDKHCGLDVRAIEYIKEKITVWSIKAHVRTDYNRRPDETTSHLPNVTILCVCSPDDVIVRSRTREFQTGPVR